MNNTNIKQVQKSLQKYVKKIQINLLTKYKIQRKN